MERFLFINFMLIIVIFIFPAETGGPIYSKCAPAGAPLSIQCDTWSIIYVRQTMYSEYYGVPNVNCQLPSYNTLCHTFSNTSDFYFNGKYRAEHTFVSEKLAAVGQTFGLNCNHSSTVKVVQILYECLTELERTSICENRERYGEVDGLIFNPGFPDPVRQQHGGCTCRITATDWGVVRLKAIIINPVHPHTGSGRWSLTVRINDDQVYSLDQMYRLSTDIGIPDTNSLVLDYSNGGDTTFLPIMVPRVPTGFWIKYSAFPLTSRLHVTCSVQDENVEKLSSGLIAVIGSLTGVTVLIIAIALILIIKRFVSKRTQKRPLFLRYLNNLGGSQGMSVRSGVFSELDKEFHFLRCNTLSSISRYNSLPPNFIFKNKKRKLSSTKSKDSGIATIDIRRNESFKQAVDDSEDASKALEKELKAEESDEICKQEVTSTPEAIQNEVESPNGAVVFEFLSVFGATDDEVDV